MSLLGVYLLNVLIALDQLCCALLGGWPDETMSSYAYRMRLERKPFGFLASWIDWGARVLFGQQDHCHKAYLSERKRSQEPPELR
jgi:hypothetical protein